jgi:hypothetical protein
MCNDTHDAVCGSLRTVNECGGNEWKYLGVYMSSKERVRYECRAVLCCVSPSRSASPNLRCHSVYDPSGNSPFRVINDRGRGRSKETGALEFARDLADAWGDRVQIHRRQSLRPSRRWSGEIIIV